MGPAKRHQAVPRASPAAKRTQEGGQELGSGRASRRVAYGGSHGCRGERWGRGANQVRTCAWSASRDWPPKVILTSPALARLLKTSAFSTLCHSSRRLHDAKRRPQPGCTCRFYAFRQSSRRPPFALAHPGTAIATACRVRYWRRPRIFENCEGQDISKPWCGASSTPSNTPEMPMPVWPQTRHGTALTRPPRRIQSPRDRLLCFVRTGPSAADSQELTPTRTRTWPPWGASGCALHVRRHGHSKWLTRN